MKKLLLSIFASVLFVSSASAELGVNIGVSASAGLFAATANEKFTPSSTDNKNQNGSEHGSAAWGSVFIEKTIGSVLVIGVDYVPGALSTDTTESAKSDKQTAGATASAANDAITAATNKIQIDFEDLTTVYLAARMGENFYAKAGVTHVDVVTNENLGTGGAYGNVELDGTMFGLGYNHTTDNGAFIRLEGNYLSFDGNTVTNSVDSEKSIKLKNLDGVSGKISIGKSF